jgi:hypothetical protein
MAPLCSSSATLVLLLCTLKGTPALQQASCQLVVRLNSEAGFSG